MRVLVTGGAGFIGSNFIRHLLQTIPDAEVVNLDALTYAGNLENLEDLQGDSRYRFVKADISSRPALEAVFSILTGPVDAVVNFAAESHVDRSILDSADFVRTNVVGTQMLLEAVREHRIARFVQVSTDEVYGSLGEKDEPFTEETPLAPNSPYSASKAAADLLVRAYHETYGLDTVITRCGNNYGNHQFPEKLIPLMILNAMADEPLPVYGDGLNVRDWIHVGDHCSALLKVLELGGAGEVYNIGAGEEKTNLEVVKRILTLLGKPDRLIQFTKDRPGHDRRYAVNPAKIQQELGWEPTVRFEEGLPSTIDWYRNNPGWVSRVQSAAYRDYYRRLYLRREETLAQI